MLSPRNTTWAAELLVKIKNGYAKRSGIASCIIDQPWLAVLIEKAFHFSPSEDGKLSTAEEVPRPV